MGDSVVDFGAGAHHGVPGGGLVSVPGVHIRERELGCVWGVEVVGWRGGARYGDNVGWVEMK